jgi:hypothetical protein
MKTIEHLVVWAVKALLKERLSKSSICDQTYWIELWIEEDKKKYIDDTTS